MSELESGFRISELLALVRRQFLVVGAALLVGAVVGYLLLSSAPTTYGATARVEVGPDPTETGPGGAPAEPVMETEADLVKSDGVADAVKKELELGGENRAVLRRITVVTTEKSKVMQITFAADSAAEARDGANVAAAAYLFTRRSGVAKTQNSRVKRLDSQIADASKEVIEAQATVDGARANTPERAAAAEVLRQASADLTALQTQRRTAASIEPGTVGSLVRKAATPDPITSKKALAKGVGVFGLFALAGLAAAWLLDRRHAFGGGRRRIEQLVPEAAMRVMPGADGRSAPAAEVDTAIDRLAVELIGSSGGGRARSVLIIGAGLEPPVVLAEELASSLAFAGIPALFILAGATDHELRGAHVVNSFADLLTGPSVTGPASLPETAGVTGTTTATPTVTWLRPRGSAEASGLLRRAVVEALVTRAGRERFEAVVFVAPAPARTAAGTALGQWVDRTALVVERGDRSRAEDAATALAGADIAVAEVVWT